MLIRNDFPGCIYLLSMWYKHDEAIRRFAIFFNSVTLAGAFGGLLASGIFRMDRDSGYAGWRWIFIIEGIMTIFVAILSFFFITDFPETATWLSKEEKEFMQRRLSERHHDDPEDDLSLKAALIQYFSDYKSYLGALLYFGKWFWHAKRSRSTQLICHIGGTIVGYSVSYFLPTIVKGFHYSSIQTQLHAVPPFAAAWAFSILLSLISAKVNHRLGFVIFSILVGLAGAGILFNVHDDVKTEYGAVCLLAMGLFGALPIALCWYTMNLRGHRERSVGTAGMIGFGNAGGFVATFSFQTKDAPEYHNGYIIVIFGLCLTGACTIAYSIGCYLENRRVSEKALKKDAL